MQTRDTIETLLRQNYSYLAREYGVKRLGLFGSYAKGSPSVTSDVDIIVEFDQPLGFRFVEFAEELERLLGRRVDVLTQAGLEGIRQRRVADDIAQSVVYV